MKSTSTKALALFCLFCCCRHQNNTTLDQFIQSKGNYIALDDTEKLNTTIKNCVPNIEKYLTGKNEKLENYYTDTLHMKLENNSIFIALKHIDGFKVLFNSTKENTKQKGGALTVVTGNLSGKDGNIEIDRTSLKIKGFLLYQ